MMGSDWLWELRVSMADEAVFRTFFALAAERDLRMQRPDGQINLFSKIDTGMRTVQDPLAALAAMAAGNEYGQLWAAGEVDICVSLENGTLTWSLDSISCFRRPVPEADAFRELHARLTDLWLAAAQHLNADVGRVLDEWSSDQIWHWGMHEAVHPSGGWPAELGWWTYLGPQHRQTPPLPEIASRTRMLSNGARLVTLLDDPAAVDVQRYEDIHVRWFQA